MQLEKRKMIILLRSGIEIWIDADRAENLQKQIVSNSGSKFVNYDDRVLNSADISGIFTPQDLEELHRRKRGEWKCKYNKWHTRDDSCYCGQNIKKEIPKATITPEQAQKNLDKFDELAKKYFKEQK